MKVYFGRFGLVDLDLVGLVLKVYFGRFGLEGLVDLDWFVIIFEAVFVF